LLEWSEIVLRLGVATLAGGLIGLDRDLHGKPIGLKTLGLVGLATAMVVMLALPAGAEDIGSVNTTFKFLGPDNTRARTMDVTEKEIT